ncbi:MAG: cadherin-like domain-containing protein [Actinobacteria bacterium]|nr:cadherin-like domain-containing protein [Actinomycetota bacterium]
MLHRAALGAVVLAGASFLLAADPATAEPPRGDHRHGAENQPPMAVDDPLVVAPGSSVRIRPMANDHDPDDDDMLTLTGVTPAVVGDVVVEVQGTTIRVHTSDDAAPGTRRFLYTVTDGHGATATGVLEVTVERTATATTSTTAAHPTTTAASATPGAPSSPTTTRDPTGPTGTSSPVATSTSGDPGEAATSSTTDTVAEAPVDTAVDASATDDRAEDATAPTSTSTGSDDGGSGDGLVGVVAVLTLTFGVAALIAYRRFARN